MDTAPPPAPKPKRKSRTKKEIPGFKIIHGNFSISFK